MRIVLVAAASFALAGTASASPPAFMRGMTVSCPGYGQIWGAPPTRHAYRELSTLGVDWAALHPYARVTRDGAIQYTPPGGGDYLDRAVAIAKEEGIALLWKPHLAYWGSFSWRGAIDFGDDDAAWARFFAAYERFIVDHARFAERHRLPVLSIGLEYGRTMRFAEQWRRIIRAVRAAYSGRITYGANWDELDHVPFWGELDLIGVQAYFPLGDAAAPDDAALAAAWLALRARLDALAKRHDKPLLFTEIGYARHEEAARRPWEPALDARPEVIALRTRLMHAALTQMRDWPRLAGAFWWKWMPEATRDDLDFSMKDPEARAALRHHWGEPLR